MKACSACKAEKSADCFYPDKTKKTGLSSRCRECVRVKCAEYRKTHLDELRAYDIERGLDPERKRQAALWKKANADIARAHRQKSNAKNIERIRARDRARYASDPKGRRAHSIEWEKSNPERAKAIRKLAKARRRARERSAQIVEISSAQLLMRMHAQGNRCVYCDGPFEHVDHLKPLALGGPNCLANLRPACAPCNLSKNDAGALHWIKKAIGRPPLPLP